MHLIGCEKHLHSSCLSNESRQPLCSTPPGDQAQGSAPMPEDGMRPGDAPRACQRQVESSAHAVAVNRRNRRSGKLSDSIHQRLSHLCEAKSLRAGECADFGKVSTGRKKTLVASDNEARRRVFCQFLDSRRECHDASAGKTVGAVSRSELQDRSMVLPFYAV